MQLFWNTKLAGTNVSVLELGVCSGDQIVTGRSLTQGITPNDVLALDISIHLTKTTEAFCSLKKVEEKNMYTVS
jgi:hypothetical protein